MEDEWNAALAKKSLFLIVRFNARGPPSLESFGSFANVYLPALLPDLGKYLGAFLMGVDNIGEGIVNAEATVFKGNVLTKLMKGFEEFEMCNTAVRRWLGRMGKIEVREGCRDVRHIKVGIALYIGRRWW